ncbi:MAG: hypothetical protein H0V12_04275 [Chloroflexi bacterium]|nr:hypothetical protein [Chloroflexota bacterium]
MSSGQALARDSGPVGIAVGGKSDDPDLSIRNLTIDEPDDGYVVARFRVVLCYPTISGVTVHHRTSEARVTAIRPRASSRTRVT